jgi:nucleoside-triphosphatase
MMNNLYLVTGEPQAGKTTLTRKVMSAMGKEACGGFYTEEIRVQGARTGSKLVTLDGQSSLLAHIHSKSPLQKMGQKALLFKAGMNGPSFFGG